MTTPSLEYRNVNLQLICTIRRELDLTTVRDVLLDDAVVGPITGDQRIMRLLKQIGDPPAIKDIQIVRAWLHGKV